MNTRLIRIAEDPESSLSEGAAVLASGGVLAFPTETVYGIAVKSGDESLAAKLREAKGREENKPFQLLVAGFDDLDKLGIDVAPRVRKLLENFWPGALTAVLPDKEGNFHGLRMPDMDFVLELIRRIGAPLVATSANMAGEEVARDGGGVLKALGGRVDLVLDGGPAKIGEPSTVIKISDGDIEILRAGAVSAADIMGEWA